MKDKFIPIEQVSDLLSRWLADGHTNDELTTADTENQSNVTGQLISSLILLLSVGGFYYLFT